MKEQLIKQFAERYNTEPDHVFFCPGRVNLIGEHIDYNGGRVMPGAIEQGTYLAVRKNDDNKFRFHSLDFPETAEIKLQTSYSRSGKQWINYPVGVINEFVKSDHKLSGLDMLFAGNLPVGAGLSSSASIEVLTAFALSELFHHHVLLTDIALLSKKVENEFFGLNSGIMDQFAVANGKEGKAILLNCDTLEFEYLNFDPKGYQLVIINTNKKRELVGSKYNERFAECAVALTILKEELPVENLCDVSPADFELNKHLITDPTIQRRAEHVIFENARVKDAAIALQTGDMEVFGKLLYASHQSLKELYEVSGKELDTIVDFCKNFPACIGARMTGAGFGGCAIALVKPAKIDEFTEQLTSFYKEKVGYAPGIFVTEISDGVRRI
jgi:galactokinase